MWVVERWPTWLALVVVLCGASGCGADDAEADAVRIGSKKFTESVVLGEVMRGLVASTDVAVVHERELGGTRVLWSALVAGDIDAYPEYTGTLEQEIFAGRALPDADALRAALAEHGVAMTAPVGFNNTYALGMVEARAEALGITAISDLRAHPALEVGLSSEFLDRADGWGALQAAYGLPQRDVRGLDHDLAYRGLVSGDLDVIDLYTTDAEIAEYDLRVLVDDREHFPRYDAVVLYRQALARRSPGAVGALRQLEGAVDEPNMIALNRRARIDRVPEAQVAADWLRQSLAVEVAVEVETRTDRLLRHTGEHLVLVGISLAAALVVALPLGVLAARRRRLGRVVLGVVGTLQTVPSLALLVVLVPVMGIGAAPAILALFLYSLLPIVQNTHAGLTGISPATRDSARALGLTPWARLRLVFLPLAAPTILAGIKTAAVINVGTATLGALIGAGGYGQPILTGIRLDDAGLILEGAIPAAVLALAMQGGFGLLERVVVSPGLRQT